MMDLLPALAFCVVVAAELCLPLRTRSRNLGERWVGNLGLFLANALLGLWLAPLLATIGGAVATLPGWPLWLAAFLGLDLLGYATHRLFHWAPVWRIHAVHHTDADVDATTAFRHHPLEFAATLATTSLLGSAIGIAPTVVAAYGAVALAAQMLQHANLSFPDWLERPARALFVTPGMHRIHHSHAPVDANANFGTVLSIWDRLFRTYRRTAAGGGEPAAFGVAEFAAPRYQRLPGMLLTPLY